MTRGTLLAGLHCRPTPERALYHSGPLRRESLRSLAEGFGDSDSFGLISHRETASSAAASPGNCEARLCRAPRQLKRVDASLLMRIENAVKGEPVGKLA